VQRLLGPLLGLGILRRLISGASGFLRTNPPSRYPLLVTLSSLPCFPRSFAEVVRSPAAPRRTKVRFSHGPSVASFRVADSPASLLGRPFRPASLLALPSRPALKRAGTKDPVFNLTEVSSSAPLQVLPRHHDGVQAGACSAKWQVDRKKRWRRDRGPL
jgi:hypothetical protein